MDARRRRRHASARTSTRAGLRACRATDGPARRCDAIEIEHAGAKPRHAAWVHVDSSSNPHHSQESCCDLGPTANGASRNRDQPDTPTAVFDGTGDSSGRMGRLVPHAVAATVREPWRCAYFGDRTAWERALQRPAMMATLVVILFALVAVGCVAIVVVASKAAHTRSANRATLARDPVVSTAPPRRAPLHLRVPRALPGMTSAHAPHVPATIPSTPASAHQAPAPATAPSAARRTNLAPTPPTPFAAHRRAFDLSSTTVGVPVVSLPLRKPR